MVNKFAFDPKTEAPAKLDLDWAAKAQARSDARFVRALDEFRSPISERISREEVQGYLEGLAARASRDEADRLARKVEMEVAWGILRHPDRYMGRYDVLARSGAWDAPAAIALSGLPEDSKPLDSYNERSGYPSVGKALTAVRDYIVHGEPPFLTLSGATGVGKSHLARAIGLAYCQMGVMALYRTEVELVDELLAVIGQPASSHADSYADFCEAPLLIIDDLGVVDAQRWTAARLDALIDARYTARAMTVITTNALGSQLPPRIASRLRDVSMGRVVQIAAEDYRLRKG